MDDQTLSKALSLILDRLEEAKRDAEDASQQAFATRSALAATLKEHDPVLGEKFQVWIKYFQPHVSRHGADSELDEIRRQLAQLLPK
jgi:hypothetical protein